MLAGAALKPRANECRRRVVRPGILSLALHQGCACPRPVMLRIQEIMKNAEDADMCLLFLVFHPNAVVGGDLLAGAAQGAARTNAAAVLLPRPAPTFRTNPRNMKWQGQQITMLPSHPI